MSLSAKLTTAIISGKLDKALPIISAAIASRKRTLVEIRAASIDVGDTVVFCHNGKPDYLKGAKAEVIERLFGKYDFLVKITTYTGGKYSVGSSVRVAASMVTKEEE